MEEDRKDVLQWHPAFYADLQIEFQEETYKLMFQNEYPLSKKPMLVDILVIKKKKGEKIHKRKDGRWEGRYCKTRDESGKIKYGYVYARTIHER